MLNIRPMMHGDVDFGRTLTHLAGWNQTRDDWHRFLELQPDGCFLAESEGVPAGTVAAFIFEDVAWIAMVLVHPDHRGKGIGTAVMRHAMAWSESRGVRSIRLDATALGRPIYEKLHFKSDYSLARYCGVLRAPHQQPSVTVRPLMYADIDACAACDAAAHATNRTALIHALLDARDRALVAVDGDSVTGFITWRPGEHATHVGPCIATNDDAGASLLHMASAALTGKRVFIDLIDDTTEAQTWARDQRLSIQRGFERMTWGRKVADRPAQIFASSGPEKG